MLVGGYHGFKPATPNQGYQLELVAKGPVAEGFPSKQAEVGSRNVLTQKLKAERRGENMLVVFWVSGIQVNGNYPRTSPNQTANSREARANCTRWLSQFHLGKLGLSNSALFHLASPRKMKSTPSRVPLSIYQDLGKLGA